MLAAPALAAPIVVTSIKPLQSIAAAVMKGVDEPVLLLDAGVSEHTAQLRPSQVETLTTADLIVVVGENLEAFLHHALENPDVAGRTRIVAGKLPGVTLLPLRSGGLWEPHHHGGEGAEAGEHDHDHEEAGEREHEHGGKDAHIWMDPANAAVIAEAIASALAAKDADHAGIYRANAAAFRQQLEDLSKEIAASVAPVKDKRYIVFHDAYQYFEQHFGLNPAGSITISPESPPGARRLSEIQERIRQTNAVCVFAEPQFEAKYVETVIEGTGARRGVLDGLGAGQPAGPDAYPALLRNFVADLKACLAP
jgi:zinc transport system substrate-binding protein